MNATLSLKSARTILKETVKEFTVDPVWRLSAATAYYSVFSIGPLLVLVVGVAGLLLGKTRVHQEVVRQLQALVGSNSTHLIESMMNAQMKQGSRMAVILGGAALLIGAAGVFMQLQSSLNTIWGIEARPGHGLWLFLRDRILSLAMVLAIGFLLLISMALSALVNGLTHFISRAIAMPPWLAPFFNEISSFLVIAILFALIFKVLPDVKIQWRDVWVGALGTSLLFSLGKYLLGLYLSHEATVSAYGAASAPLVILMYVYYSSVVLYFGAEFTQVYTRHRGVRVEPSKFAIRVNRRKYAPLEDPHAASRASRQPEPHDRHEHAPRREQQHDRPRGGGFWRRMLHRSSLIIPAVGLFLVIVRLALPYAVRGYLNHSLKHLKGFHGSVEQIRMNLYRGAYVVGNLKVFKSDASIREPFVSIPEMDLAVEWKELLHGSLVGRITIDDADVNFVTGPTPQRRQTGAKPNWTETLKKLFPFTINRFEINNGTIRYNDPYRKPPMEAYVTNLFAMATNLSNTRGASNALPAGLIASAQTTGHGKLTLSLRMNPMEHAPTFKLTGNLTNLDLTALNGFLETFGKFNAQHGSFALYLDVAAAHGAYQGYFKPFFFDLGVFNLKEAKHKNFFRNVWEATIQAVSRLLRNQPKNQIATQVPISGRFDAGASVDIWTTIGGILRNAFFSALEPKITPPDVPLPKSKSPAQPANAGQ